MLGIPKPAELTFQCQRISSQHYRIQSLDASAKVTPLFTIHLPESRSYLDHISQYRTFNKAVKAFKAIIFIVRIAMLVLSPKKKA